MKYTLETGMLIICIALLFVLVVFQYTNITNEDDTEEGFRQRLLPRNGYKWHFHKVDDKTWPKLIDCFRKHGEKKGKVCMRYHDKGNLSNWNISGSNIYNPYNNQISGSNII